MNKYRKCIICGVSTRPLFELKIFNKLKLLVECENVQCGQVQFQKVDWLECAYSNAIVALDTGAVQRCLNMRKLIVSIYTITSIIKIHVKKLILDYGGGTGLLCRLLRDAGLDCYSIDKYCENIYARPFEATNESYFLVTMVEVLEHLENPIVELMDIKEKYNPELIFATTLLRPKKINSEWWYLTPSTGQHINFYTENSLKLIANTIGYSLYVNGSVIIFSKRNVGLIKRILIYLSINRVVKNIVFIIRSLLFRTSYRKDFESLRTK